MANNATEADFKERYPQHEEQSPGVVTARLTSSRAFIVARMSKLTTVEANANGLIAMTQAEMMLAYEELSTRPTITAGGRTIDAGKTEGDRARMLLDTWDKWSLGQTSLHAEKIVTAPTFTPSAPETWDIDPDTST